MELLKDLKEWADVGLVITAIIYGVVQAIRKRKQKTEKVHSNIEGDVKFSIPIYDIITNILFDYPATRAFIKQFHNGNKFYSGQHIQRLTISHEKVKPGVKPLRPYHDGILVSPEVHDIIKEMDRNHRDWYFCSDIEKAQPDLFRWMQSHDSRAILYFRLYDKKTEETIGLLGLTFNHKFKLDEISDVLDITKRKKELETEFNKLE